LKLVEKLVVASLVLSSCVSVTWASEEVIMQNEVARVTKDDVRRYIIDRTPEEQRNAILSKPNIYKEIADNILIIKTLALNATSENLESYDPDQIEWSKELHGDRQKMILFIESQVKKQMESVNWNKMAKDMYNANKEKYMSEPSVRASHILISTESRNESEALKLILSIKERLNAGEAFSDLAKEVSEDPGSKMNGGDLGYFSKGRMVKPFEKIAFFQDAGQISNPVKTKFGYHLIHTVDKTGAEIRPFEKVEAKIIRELRESLEENFRQQVVSNVIADPALKVNKALLEQVKAQKLGIAN